MPNVNVSPCGGGLGPRSAAFMQEMKRLGAKSLQSVMISMGVALSTATTSGSDEYKVPSDQKLVVLGAQGFIRLTAPATDTWAIPGVNLSVQDRILLKAQNCLVSIQNQDSKLPNTLGDIDLQLAAIMPPMGLPMVWPVEAPLLFEANNTLEMNFTLQDVTASVVGGSSVYGVLLSGVLIEL